MEDLTHPEDKIEKKDLESFGGFGNLNREKFKNKIQKGHPLKLSKCDEVAQELTSKTQKDGFDPQEKLNQLKKSVKKDHS